MRVVYLAVVLCLLSLPGYSQQFQKVTEGTSKAEVLKLLGNPTKKLVGADKSTECYIWILKSEAWLVYFKDSKTTGTATNLETLLRGLMDLETSFSSIGSNGNSQSSLTAGADSQPDVAAKLTAREAAAKDQIQIDVVDSKRIETWDNQLQAGSRFRIKNSSNETISELDIVVYYYDKGGKIFFEQTFYPVINGSYTSTGVLKPNYSIMYPPESDHYMTASGMDLDEWDEGNIKVEISKITLQ